MQTENLDSGTNCTSSDKDKITSINITHDLFIPVNNLTHKVMTKTRRQNWEKTKSKNADLELSDMGIRQHTKIGIFQKRNSCLSETYSDTTEEDLYKLSGLRSMQYLKQNCLVN